MPHTSSESRKKGEKGTMIHRTLSDIWPALAGGLTAVVVFSASLLLQGQKFMADYGLFLVIALALAAAFWLYTARRRSRSPVQARNHQ